MCTRSTFNSSSHQLVRVFVIAVVAVAFAGFESLCCADDVTAKTSTRSAQQRNGYKHLGKSPQAAGHEDEESAAVVELVLSFSDPVQLTVLDIAPQAAGGEKPALLTVEPLTWDDTQWIVQLEISSLSSRQTDFLFLDGQVLVFSASEGGTSQVGANPNNRRLEEIISVDGDGELIEALSFDPDQDISVSTFDLIEDAADLENPLVDSASDCLLDDFDAGTFLKDFAQLVVLQHDASSDDTGQIAGDPPGEPRGSVCCSGTGACGEYGGDDCPGGTSQVGCPCPGRF